LGPSGAASDRVDQTVGGARVEPRGTPHRLALELLVSGGLASLPSAAAPMIGGEAAVLLDGRWRAAFFAGLTFDGALAVYDETTQPRGTLTVQTLSLLPSVMWCADVAAQPCIGLRGGARIAFGSAEGALIFHTQLVAIATPTVGVGGRVGLRWGALLGTLDAAVLVNASPPRFVVQGLEPAFELPRVDLVLQAAAGSRLW